jgi:hypothetical protein
MRFTIFHTLIVNLLIFKSSTSVFIASNVEHLSAVSDSQHDNVIDSEEFYKSRPFRELLEDFNINVDIKTLPDINDVMILLGTTNVYDTVHEIRKIASTKDGMELIRSYLGHENDKKEDDYLPSSQQKEPDSWWNKAIKWLGLEQSTKVHSLQTDLNILSKAVPPSTPYGNRIMYVGRFLKPERRAAVTIHPPFKIFDSQFPRAKGVSDYKTMPTIRLTESQYNQLARGNRRNDVLHQRVMVPVTTRSTVKNNVATGANEKSLPVRVSFDFDGILSGALHKANPQDVNQISRRLSESSE